MDPDKKFSLRPLKVLAITAVLFVSPLIAVAGQVEITGIVLVVDSYDSYELPTVAIASEDGQMYAVSADGKWAELTEHENKLVKVSGMLAIEKSGGKTITITHYELLKPVDSRFDVGRIQVSHRCYDLQN